MDLGRFLHARLHPCVVLNYLGPVSISSCYNKVSGLGTVGQHTSVLVLQERLPCPPWRAIRGGAPVTGGTGRGAASQSASARHYIITPWILGGNASQLYQVLGLRVAGKFHL